jgi:hypothetical protein
MLNGYFESSLELAPDVVALGIKPDALSSNWGYISSSGLRQSKNLGAEVGLAFSLIPDVEAVFVDLVQKQKTVRVLTVVNERNAEVRAKIYAREQTIMDEFPALDFSFRILTRMDRDLYEMMEPVGIISYRR